MNREELERRLKQAPVPEWPADYAEAFLGKVIGRVSTGAESGLPRFRFVHGVGIALAAAVAGLAMGLLVGNRLNRHDRELRVWVEVVDAKGSRVLTAVSGSHFDLNGEKIQVLANPNGNVVLVGGQFFWTNQSDAVITEGAQVRARVIGHGKSGTKL